LLQICRRPPGGRGAKWRRREAVDTTGVRRRRVGKKRSDDLLRAWSCRGIIGHSDCKEGTMPSAGNDYRSRVRERPSHFDCPLRGGFSVEAASHHESRNRTDRELTDSGRCPANVPHLAILRHVGKSRRLRQHGLWIVRESQKPLHKNLGFGLKGYPFAADHAEHESVADFPHRRWVRAKSTCLGYLRWLSLN